MSTEMGFGLSMRMEHRLSPEQKLEIRQKMEHALRLTLEQTYADLSEVSEINGAKFIETAYDETAKAVTPEQVRPVFTDLMRNELLSLIQGHKHDIIGGRHAEAAIDLFYDMYHGDFRIEDEGGKTQVVTAPKNLLERGFKTPDRLKKDISDMVEQIRRVARDEDVTGAQQELGRLNSARMVLEIIRPQIEDIKNALVTLLNTKVDGKLILNDSVIDSLIYDVLTKNGIVSDRIVKKLTGSIEADLGPRQVRKWGDVLDEGGEVEIPQRVKDLICNVVGQVVLVGLGVIDKDIFVLRKYQQDVVDDTVAAKIKEETGIGYQELLKKYNLHQPGEIYFFHRFKTKNSRPSQRNDNKIRDFITDTVRSDQNEIIKRSGARNSFEKLISNLHTLLEDKNAPIDYASELMEFVNDVFANEQFMAFLKEKMRTKYLPAMKELI